MRKWTILCGILAAGLLLMSAAGGTAKQEGPITRHDGSTTVPPKGAAVRPDLDFGKFPLYFIANHGQVNQQAVFYAKTSRYTLWLSRHSLVFDGLTRGKRMMRDVSRMMFLNANKNPRMEAVDEASLKVNFFKGNDPAGWRGGVSTSKAVLYKELYKHIDLKVYGIERAVEYDWIVKPGGDPAAIRFEYKNVKHSYIDGEGDLVIETGFGEMVHRRPAAYQEVDAARGSGDDDGSPLKVPVNAAFKKIAEHTYGFDVGTYDKNRPLIIDPVVAYSTYLGGNAADTGYDVAVDGAGYVYVAGDTFSSDFPTLDHYQSYQGDLDVFVVKIDADQSGAASLVYATYLGGALNDRGIGAGMDNMGLAVTADGTVYVVGSTESVDFPLVNQFQGNLPGTDAFVVKLDTTRSGAAGLLYSTYLGSSGTEIGRSIAADAAGNAYIVGSTQGTDWPLRNAYQGADSGWWPYFTKLDTTTSGAACLRYSTYLRGGDGFGRGYGVAVDADGLAYVVGDTNSMTFPTRNEYQSDDGGWDGFLAVFDPEQSGDSSLVYCTMLGGSSSDRARKVAVDADGYVYVVGGTYSSDFPTRGDFLSPGNSPDAFLVKLDVLQTGDPALLYGSYLGGNGWDDARGLAVDGAGRVHITGDTRSTDFPLLEETQTKAAGTDAFAACIDTTLTGASSLVYSTYLGGNDEDLGNEIAIDNAGGVYVVGETGSTDFPTLNEYQTDQPGLDAFLTKLTLPVVISPPTVTTDSATDITRSSALSGGVVRDNGGAPVTARGVCWSTAPGPDLTGDNTSDGRGAGAFSSPITGLLENTTYYVRAYAVNSAGTGYGGEKNFTTGSGALSVTITEPEDGAVVSGAVTVEATTLITRTTGTSALSTVDKVEFYIDGTLVSEDTASPYQYAWDSTAVSDGSHTIKATAYASNGQTAEDSVTVTTGNIPPHILLNRERLNYGTESGSVHTSAQDIWVENAGSGVLEWTASTDASWLNISPVSGVEAGEISVSVNPAGLSAGAYNASVIVSAAGADNSPQTVEVSLTVYDAGTTEPPFGVLSTPEEGAETAGCQPVAGWALDDVEIAGVKIYRDPVFGEGNDPVYIGNALLVEGALPDLETTYASSPYQYRAAWGYMMLTHSLPNGGNGSYTLHARAFDLEGNETLLGSRTVTCNNGGGTDPFGAIDTPAQGGIASGAQYTNYGWVLTPLPNTIPKDGSTITVWVDGVMLPGHVDYDHYRSDVAAKFPTLKNSGGAGGYFTFDTTRYENGVHTIAWAARDDAGNTGGIGSRYFRIRNPGNPANRNGTANPARLGDMAGEALPNGGPVTVITGYDAAAPAQKVKPGKDGRYTVQMKEADRVEIHLTPNTQHSTLVCSGYLDVGGRRRSLPVGASLDTEKGVFYWQPGPGFLGRYRLVFLTKTPDGRVTRRNIEIEIRPALR